MNTGFPAFWGKIWNFPKKTTVRSEKGREGIAPMPKDIDRALALWDDYKRRKALAKKEA
jgi:hypothetical protein